MSNRYEGKGPSCRRSRSHSPVVTISDSLVMHESSPQLTRLSIETASALERLAPPAVDLPPTINSKASSQRGSAVKMLFSYRAVLLRVW